MKFEPPPGRVFGGYGFWAYPNTPHARRASSTRDSPPQSWLDLRALAHAARRLLGLTRS